MRRSTTIRWQLLFGAIVLGYCLYYAPCGINETGGGFLTGLAWQVLSGKTLYADVVYVRPPLPVWLRTAELALLPAGSRRARQNSISVSAPVAGL